jgi:hypothetical protein
MPPPRTPRTVRYTGRDDNPMRLALLDVWGWRCYWDTRKALIPSETEIDHIIPQSTTPARLAELVAELGLPADFDLDSPQNLAPICGLCNNEKRAIDYLGAPLVVTKLRRAAGHADRVIRRVLDYHEASSVAHNLVAAAAADLAEPQTRGEFLQFAPAIVQTLALLDERSTDFQTTWHEDVDLGDGDILPTTMTLDARGRTRVIIIEEICGCSVGEALADGLAQLSGQAYTDAEALLSGLREETDDISRMTVTYRFTEVSLTDLHRRDGTVTAVFTGTLRAEGTAHLYRENRYSADYEMLDRAETVEIDRDFTLTASWALMAGPGAPDQVSVTVDRDNIAARHDDELVDAFVEHERAMRDGSAARKEEHWRVLLEQAGWIAVLDENDKSTG